MFARETESSFGTARVAAKAGFRVAPALCSGLHGMTVRWALNLSPILDVQSLNTIELP
jgi:hypothetical protein